MSDIPCGPGSLALVCTGLVLSRLFSSAGTGVSVGLPTLAEVLCNPGIAQEPLANLGVDSLAWLELLTTLESDLGVEVGNDFLVDEHVSAGLLGAALSTALATRMRAA